MIINNKNKSHYNRGVMQKLSWCFLLAILFVSPVWAMESFRVQDIQIIGLQRISLGTAFNYLPIKVGEIIDSKKASNIIRALYKTGFFEDIQLARDNNILKIYVEERPSIAKIDIFGNKDLSKADLNKVLRQIGLTEGHIFNHSLLDQLQQELNQEYLNRGKYGVKIDTTITKLERNRVKVTIDINEGDVSKIKQINLIGVKSFSKKELLDRFTLTTPTMWTGITDSGKYSKQELLADLESLRSFYLDRGYINFNIDSTQVSITPDRRDVYITINVTEGEKYTVSSVKLSGNLIVGKEKIESLLEVKKGDVFSRKKLVDTGNKISQYLGLSGYAFANVNAIPDINDKDRTVGITFHVEPGNRVYVRRINITGNTKTQDSVIRREVRQMEGGWLSPPLVERSKERLQKLGYFDTVNVETPKVPGTNDQVDLDFDVKEGSTGNFSAGIGYGDTQGFLFNTSVTLNNFLGTGKRLSVELNNSKVNTVYNFSYTNPYYTPDGVSRGFNVYSRKTNAAQANLAPYNTSTYGANVTYGFPISEYNRSSFSLGYDNTKLDINQSTAPQYFSDWVAANGSLFDTYTASLSWTHDTRNRTLFPNKGWLSGIYSQIALPGGDLKYYKLNLRQKWYSPLTKKITVSLGTDLGWADSYGNAGGLPFYENYYAGGSSTVRGYKGNRLGPRDAVTNDPIGGNVKIVGHAELIFPSPFGESTAKSLRISTFYDIGNVFDSKNKIQLGELRSAYGLSAVWITPVGALTFNWGWAINPKPGDDLEIFQFNIGAPF
jgi:outer membrane protein insertion porin family